MGYQEPIQLSFRPNIIIILLLSVQNIAVILILQMVMFIRGTSPAGTNDFNSFRPVLTRFFSLLNKLNKSKATGLDKISARLIRECADLICIPICDIFNQSISLGIFPDEWNCARVTPLRKHGDRDDLNNYRLISVTWVVAKVFERIVYDQLYGYLKEHDIIRKYQSGFRAIHSTVTALLEAMHGYLGI